MSVTSAHYATPGEHWENCGGGGGGGSSSSSSNEQEKVTKYGLPDRRTKVNVAPKWWCHRSRNL